MGKIYPVSTKYTVLAEITVEGEINKNDIIGAIFGQTEGLLGKELELRELQKSGRIGRIEVSVSTEGENTFGIIKIPSSITKEETSIIAAALETIDKIGPYHSEITVKEITDVRFSKRNKIQERAKQLLKGLNSSGADSQAMMEDVKQSAMARDIIEFGKDKLTASADINKVKEVLIVEGRADVVNLLKYELTGLIEVNGVNVSKSIIPLLKTKTCTLFVDGDRGGELIINKILKLGDLDYIAVAPDGKEVEELTGKEIFKALRNKKKVADYLSKKDHFESKKFKKSRFEKKSNERRTNNSHPTFNSKFKLLNELSGSKGAYFIDKKENILAKLPISEIEKSLKKIKGVKKIILDGELTADLIKICEKKKIKTIIANTSKAKSDKIEITTK